MKAERNDRPMAESWHDLGSVDDFAGIEVKALRRRVEGGDED